MGVSSSQSQPQELVTFTRLQPGSNISLASIAIPEGLVHRRPTNVKWLIIFVLCVVALIPFLIYTFDYSDIKRVIKGYDRCGNICGQRNYQWVGINCSGQNLINFPYLEYDDGWSIYSQGGDCVQTCRRECIPVMGRCQKKFRQEPGPYIVAYFDSVKWQIIISCLLSILVTIGMVVLFKYAISLVLWSILIGCFMGFVLIIACICYGKFKETQNRDYTGIVLLSLATIGFGLILYWSRGMVPLLILLLKETSKVLFDMPGLMTIRLICVIVIFIVTIIVGFLHLVIDSAGTLQKTRKNLYEYVPDSVIIITMVYNGILYLWICHFCMGIQYLITAGATAKWYFTRDKNCLTSPIMTSVSITFRFHLGTAALGAMVITLVQVIKIIFRLITRRQQKKLYVEACFKAMEKWFRFLSITSYTVTAMHGQAFISSGKRASKLIIDDVSDFIEIYFLADFVFIMAKVLVVLITLLYAICIFAIAPGNLSSSNMDAYYVIAFISAVVAWVTLGVYETIVDTLLICFCEDSVLNDGVTRPYYMSRNLKEFVDNAKNYSS